MASAAPRTRTRYWTNGLTRLAVVLFAFLAYSTPRFARAVDSMNIELPQLAKAANAVPFLGWIAAIAATAFVAYFANEKLSPGVAKRLNVVLGFSAVVGAGMVFAQINVIRHTLGSL